MNRFSIACLFLISLGSASADVRLPNLLSDHIVFQRDKPINVWGWVEPDESISLSFGGAPQSTKAGEGGKCTPSNPPVRCGLTFGLEKANYYQ